MLEMKQDRVIWNMNRISHVVYRTIWLRWFCKVT